MQVKTFFEENSKLVSTEIEIQLIKGLPKIQFIGLVDQNIKESALRIQSAIRSSGFQFPRGKQILVNFKSSRVRLSSRGVELAIAYAILRETDQIKSNKWDQAYFFGELNLEGQVSLPRLDEGFNFYTQDEVILGKGEVKYKMSLMMISNLKDLEREDLPCLPSPESLIVRPSLEGIFVHKEMANLLILVALGGLSALIAGPAGSGKSFFADLIWRLREEPDLKELSSQDSWHLLIKPHHLSSAQGLLGGQQGERIANSELSRSRNGVLVLDELLEFKPQVIESLREPLENGEIRLARSSGITREKFQAQVLATTNLCPCGDYVPKQTSSCRYSLARCRSYSQRISGPLVDRFQLLIFSHVWKGARTVPLIKVLEDLTRIRRTLTREELNQVRPFYKLKDAEFPLGIMEKELLNSITDSQRRRISLLKVARVVAWIDGEKDIKTNHLRDAASCVIEPFLQLKRWD